MEFPELIFIVGPTAVGKTALSLELAERLQRPILSCDSLCFYKGMDVGTAKPNRAERERVRHYGVNLVEPAETYDIGRYQQYALQCHRDHAADDGLIVSGGSGFYLKSFFAPVTDNVRVPEPIRVRVQELGREKGLEGLIEALRACNPDGTGKLDLQNPRRVEKALMRCWASGKTVCQLQEAFDRQQRPFDGISRRVVVLTRPMDELEHRIKVRTRQMLAGDLIEEVRRLRARGLELNPSGRDAIGYRETLAYLDGELSLSELESAINLHTRQLVRKQRNWLRKQVPVDLELDAGSATTDAILSALPH